MQTVGSQPAPPKGAKVAFRQGLFFGLVLAGVNDTLYILNSVFNQAPTATTTNSAAVGTSVLIGFAVGCLIFLLDLGAYFGAGILASRQTARVSTGTFAGIWAGAIYGLIDFIVKVVIQFTITIPANAQALQSTSPNTAQSTANILGVAGIVGAFVLVLAAIGVGAGLGSLGGLIGRNISKVKLPERALVPYPGPLYGMYAPMYGMQGQNWQPQPGMPAYPYPYAQAMPPGPGYAPVSINDGYAVPLQNPAYAPPVQQNESKPHSLALPEQADNTNWASRMQDGEQGYQEHTDDEDRTQRLNPWHSSLP